MTFQLLLNLLPLRFHLGHIFRHPISVNTEQSDLASKKRKKKLMCLKWLLDFINIKIIRDECYTLYVSYSQRGGWQCQWHERRVLMQRFRFLGVCVGWSPNITILSSSSPGSSSSSCVGGAIIKLPQCINPIACDPNNLNPRRHHPYISTRIIVSSGWWAGLDPKLLPPVV